MVQQLQTKKLHQKNVLWNMIFSVLNAGQSMLLLMIVNRLMGEDTAGIFSFAFSVAVLMMYIGNYGIRNYQVSDVKERFSFGQYCGLRIITCVIMMICCVGYVFIKGYQDEKAILVILLCTMRMVECMEDVFHGRYQQKQRLDMACMQGTIRITFSMVAFAVTLAMTHNIVTGVAVYTAVNFLCFLLLTMITIPHFGGLQIAFNRKTIVTLLVDCFPLFCGYFFSTYLGNVSKYAIDDYGTNQMQAHYNMIFMPVLVINLVSTMIFRPIIVDMATLWNNREDKAFRKLVWKQLLLIGLLAVVMIPAGIWIGLPILSYLYGANLREYQMIFFILLLGGVCSAVASFLNVCIITVRKQYKLLVVIVMISALAAVFGGNFVKHQGMFGAALLYLVLTFVQAIGYLWIQMTAKLPSIDN